MNSIAQYGFVTCRAVGNPERGFSVETYPDHERYNSYDEAHRAGVEELGSDDLFIAEYSGDKCVAVFLYEDGEEKRVTDEEEIDEVNNAL